MSTRQHETERWGDPWHIRLTPIAKLVFGYLCDACDCAGFREYDAFEIHRATGLSEDDVDGAMKELTRPYKGACKVLLRGLQGASEGDLQLVWVRNRAKLQLTGSTLNPANRFCRGVLRRFQEHLGIFPEIEGAYKVLASPPKGVTRTRQRQSTGTGTRISEWTENGDEVAGPRTPARSPRRTSGDADPPAQFKGQDPVFDLMLNESTLLLPYESFCGAKRKFPKADALDCMKTLIHKDSMAAGGLDDYGLYFDKLMETSHSEAVTGKPRPGKTKALTDEDMEAAY